MGPRGHLCCFDNSPQDGVRARALEESDIHRHPPSNARPCYPPPMFAVSNPALEEVKDNPGWSPSELAGSHQHQSQGSKRKSVIAPSAHTGKLWSNGDRKVACLKAVPHVPTQAW